MTVMAQSASWLMLLLLCGGPLLAEGARPVSRGRPVMTEIVLVRDGEPHAVIAAPREDAHRNAAREIQRAVLKATGARLPVIDDVEAEKRFADQNLVVIGNLMTNRVAERWIGPWVTEMNPPLMPPRERAYDKVSFRSKIDKDSTFLLLDGLSGFGMAHADANNIVQLWDKGNIWLHPAGYMVYEVSEHNMVVVTRNGEGGTKTVPMLADLELYADMDRFGAVRSTLHNYNGTEWARNILWARDRYFLVVDELTAAAPGDYVLQCWWKTGGPLEGRRLGGTGAEVRWQVVSLNDSSLAQTRSRHNVPQLRCSHTATLEPGDTRVFMNLLQVTRAPHEHEVDARRLTVSASVLRRDGKILESRLRDDGLVSFELPAGRHELRVAPPGADDLSAIEAALRAAWDKAKLPPDPTPGLKSDAPQLAERWRFENPGDNPVQAHVLKPADLDGDGVSEILLGSADNVLRCFDSGGTPLWQFEADEQVASVWTGDLRGDGSVRVLVGTGRGAIRGKSKAAVYILDARGREEASIPYPASSIGTVVGLDIDGDGVRALEVADLDGRGGPEIVCGTDAGQVFVLSANGAVVVQGKAPGLVRFVAVSRTDADGAPPIVAATDGPGLCALNWTPRP